MTEPARHSDVWLALEGHAAAPRFRLRAGLMREAQRLVRDSGLNQTQAARHAGVTQPRMSDLMQGRISRFSAEALVDVIGAFGERVELSFHASDKTSSAVR
jgi:predicted XRE-type DNA-binding protein